MFENIEAYFKGAVEWLKKLYTIIFDFLGDIGVEA